uniref:Uncharacterized protein n=1 Tax=Amphimedon queenslandica TaxID=400682 RepID=A0A1X7TEY6_AMPQE
KKQDDIASRQELISACNCLLNWYMGRKLFGILYLPLFPLLFMMNNTRRTPLGIACHEGRTEIVKLLLEQDRVCVNATDKDSGKQDKTDDIDSKQELIWLCLQLSAELHTALQIAFEKQPQKQHTEIVELLLKHKGVDVNVTDKDN